MRRLERTSGLWPATLGG